MYRIDTLAKSLPIRFSDQAKYCYKRYWQKHWQKYQQYFALTRQTQVSVKFVRTIFCELVFWLFSASFDSVYPQQQHFSVCFSVCFCFFRLYTSPKTIFLNLFFGLFYVSFDFIYPQKQYF